LHVIRRDFAELERFLARFAVEHVCYGFESVNCALVESVRRVWPHARHADFNPVEALRASKTPAALERFRDAFARSSAAIAETMRWAKPASRDGATPNTTWRARSTTRTARARPSR
jgi:Xaa-Pro aminopeptidase